MKSLSFKKRSLLTIILIGSMTLLSGCAFIKNSTALPDKERYHYINAIKDAMELETFGPIVEEGYDTGDGVYSPSSYYANIKGLKAYGPLYKKLQTIPNAECQFYDARQTNCTIKQIMVQMTVQTNNTVLFHVIDKFGGRNPK
jgi:hypothetical protein